MLIALAIGAFVLGIYAGRGVSSVSTRTAELNTETIASYQRTVALMQQAYEVRTAQLIVARRYALHLEAFVHNCHPMVSLS